MSNKALPKEKVNPYIVKLSKSYKFENIDYTEIDLSALDSLGTQALLDAERIWTMNGNASNQMETNYAYCLEVAAIATQKPIEFFLGLPMKDGIVVKGTVQKHFLGLMELPEAP